MKSATAKIVLKLLNFDQKESLMDIAQASLTMFNNDPYLLKKVVTATDHACISMALKTKTNPPNCSI